MIPGSRFLPLTALSLFLCAAPCLTAQANPAMGGGITNLRIPL